jgi:hypothetical protein
MVDRKVEFEVGFKAGDVSGITALDNFEKDVIDVQKVLAEARESGSFRGFAVDSRELDAASKAVEAMASRMRLLSKDIADARIELANLEQTDPEYEKQAAKVAKLTKEFVDLERQIERVPRSLGNLEERFDSLSREVGIYGDTESQLRTVTGAIGFAGGAGGAQLERTINLGAEGFAVAEALPRLAEGVSQVGIKIREASPAVNSFAGGLTKVLPGLSAGAAGFVALGAAMLPIVGVIGALTISYSNQAKEAARARENTERSLNVQERYFQVLATGTTEEVQNAIASLEAENAIIEARRRAIQEQYDLIAETESAGTQFAVAAANLITQNLAEIDAALESGAITQAEAQQQIALILEQVDELGQQQVLRVVQANEELRALYGDQGISLSTLTAAGRELDTQLQSNNQLLALYAEALETNATAEADRLAALDAQADALVRQAQIQRQVEDLIRQGNDQQIIVRRQAIESEIASLQALTAELEPLADESEAAANYIDEYTSRVEALTYEQSLLTDSAVELARARQSELQAVQEQLTAIERRVSQEVQLAEIMRSGSTEQITSRLDAIESEREAINRILPEVRTLAETSAEAAAQVQQYEQRLAELNDEFQFLSSDAIDAAHARELAEALTEVTEAEKEASARIVEIRSQALESLQKAEQKHQDNLAKILSDNAAKLRQINDKEGKARAEATAKFFADERKAVDDYYKEEKERLRDQNAERLKILEELGLALTEAEERNDVVAFIAAKRRAEEKLKSEDQEASEEVVRRREQYFAEREEAQKAHDDRLDQIAQQAREARDSQGEAFRQAQAQAQEAFETEKQQIEEQARTRVEAEKAQLRDRVTAIMAGYSAEKKQIEDIAKARTDQLKKQDEMLSKQMATRDEMLSKQIDERARKEADTAKRIAEARVSAEAAAFQRINADLQAGFTSTISVLRTQLQSLISGLASQSLQKGIAFGNTSGPAKKTLRGVAFANEGVITMADGPTVALLGERLRPGEVEAVVKFEPSKGLPASLGSGGPMYNISTGDIVIGNGMSRDDVINAIRESWMQAIAGMEDAKRS